MTGFADAEEVPAPFSPDSLWHGWEFVPLVIIPVVVVAVVYLIGYHRVRRQAKPVFPRYRAWSFIAGLVALVVSVDGPMDTYADVDLAAHMAQHLVLLDLVAPLVVLGAPITVALRATDPAGRSAYLLPLLRSRPVHLLSNPWVVVALYAAALLGTHFTPFFNLALYHEHIHDLEHLCYLVAGILIWALILAVDPVRPPRPSLQGRTLVVMAQMLVMTAIAAVFFFAAAPLYPYYPALPPPWGGQAFALSNQRLAGAVMCIPSLAASIVAMAYLSRKWNRAEQTRHRRARLLQTPGRPDTNNQ